MSDPKKTATEWFDPLYQQAAGDADKVPWARSTTHPELKSWLKAHDIQGEGRRALAVGCGLGDDAEELSRRGFKVTAFDISETAIEWCRQRFPETSVHYEVADLFALPADWQQAFDFVLECYTIQALPLALREQTMGAIAALVKPRGELLVICHGRSEDITEPPGPPWPLTRSELELFRNYKLTELDFVENPETGTDTEVYYRIRYQKMA